MIKSPKGFTLIELLVVIAIIGILSSVVLASLNSARARGADAAIQADIDAIRAQVAIVYDTNNLSYNTSGNLVKNTSCDTLTSPTIDGTVLANSTVQAAIKHAAIQSSNGIVCNIAASGNAFLIAGRYKSDTAKWWCLDNTVAKKWASVLPPTENDTVCQ